MNSFSFIIPSTSTCGEKSVKYLFNILLSVLKIKFYFYFLTFISVKKYY
ncbi:hypothetical protein [Spiroplasma endosymbiont of Apeira syringaria]